MKTVCIVVGHTPNGGGAVNDKTGMTEFDFNNEMAPMIAESLRRQNVRPIIVYRETYSKLVGHVNDTKADVCLSLHCNAFNDKANGAEVLYHHKSKNGKALAALIQDQVVACLGNKNRGIKAIDYDHTGKAGDRGGWLVEKTSMPCVIVEPFFIDSDESLEAATALKKQLANGIAVATATFIRNNLEP